MLISEWFDPYNPEHMRAYVSLLDWGFWPREFYDLMIEANIIPESNWLINIQSKLANAWTKRFLEIQHD